MSFTTRKTYPLNLPDAETVRRSTAQDWPTLRRMAAAAARQSLGKSYSDEDRAELAAHLVTWTMARRINDHAACCICGGPAAYRLVSFTDDYGDSVAPSYCIGHAASRETARRITAPDWTMPSYSALYSEGANYRRSIDAQRRRDGEHAPSLQVTTPVRPESTTPDASHRRALDICGALGMTGDYPLYVLAYCEARQWIERTPDGGIMLRDGERERAAEELGVKWPTVRQYLARLAKRMPSLRTMTAGDHAAALGVIPDESTERAHAARLPDGWRDSAPDDIADHAPVTVAHAAPSAHAAPDWTVGLHPATAARYSHADRIRRERAAARTADERTALRATVGLPATVR